MGRVRQVAIIAVMLTPSAWAAQGKAGTWEVTSQLEGPATQALLKMVQMFPPWHDGLKSRGVRFGDGGRMTMRYCVTAEQVKADRPVVENSGSCHTANLTVRKNHLTADVVCSGRWNGTGRLDITFDGPERYRGEQVVTARLGGISVTRKMMLDARWLSPTCTP